MTYYIHGVITLERERNASDGRLLLKQAQDLEAGARALNLTAETPWPDSYPAGVERVLTPEGRYEVRFCYSGTEAQIEDARVRLRAFIDNSRYTDGNFGTSNL